MCLLSQATSASHSATSFSKFAKLLHPPTIKADETVGVKKREKKKAFQRWVKNEGETERERAKRVRGRKERVLPYL